jgi:hypothetical protein
VRRTRNTSKEKTPVYNRLPEHVPPPARRRERAPAPPVVSATAHLPADPVRSQPLTVGHSRACRAVLRVRGAWHPAPADPAAPCCGGARDDQHFQVAALDVTVSRGPLLIDGPGQLQDQPQYNLLPLNEHMFTIVLTFIWRDVFDTLQH